MSNFGDIDATLVIHLATLACYGRLPAIGSNGSDLIPGAPHEAKIASYYNILGLPQCASPTMIHSAYRKLARQHHPDMNNHRDIDCHFRLISEAYEVLKLEVAHKTFDEMICPRAGSSSEIGHAWQLGRPPSWDGLMTG